MASGAKSEDRCPGLLALDCGRLVALLERSTSHLAYNAREPRVIKSRLSSL
ncbi:MAG TPA: hypothetical protein VNH83_09240 [Bryobacteraceae bacterium]|nr:hypothetical protein [Bryobacteraceae bacterium]